MIDRSPRASHRQGRHSAPRHAESCLPDQAHSPAQMTAPPTDMASAHTDSAPANQQVRRSSRPVQGSRRTPRGASSAPRCSRTLTSTCVRFARQGPPTTADCIGEPAPDPPRGPVRSAHWHAKSRRRGTTNSPLRRPRFNRTRASRHPGMFTDYTIPVRKMCGRKPGGIVPPRYSAPAGIGPHRSAVADLHLPSMHCHRSNRSRQFAGRILVAPLAGTSPKASRLDPCCVSTDPARLRFPGVMTGDERSAPGQHGDTGGPHREARPKRLTCMFVLTGAFALRDGSKRCAGTSLARSDPHA